MDVLAVGLFPEGMPRLQTPEQLKQSLPRVDPSYKTATALDFPESYDDARSRCANTARHLADAHPNDNILLVGHGLSVEYLVSELGLT